MLAEWKYAWRRLLKSPSFAITAILTLALGIGANAVVRRALAIDPAILLRDQ